MKIKQKNNIQITLITSFITLFLISFNASADTLSDKVTACNVAMNKGDLTSAISVSDEILKLDSKSHDGLLCKGRALGAKGDYAEGLNTLEMAAKQSQPGFEQVISYIFIGNLHKSNNKYTSAIAAYETSIKICDAEKNDKFKRINLNLIGDTHTQNNDLNAALASYQAATKLAMNDNERAENFEHLAATYSALNQHNAAIEYQLKATLMQDKAGTRDDYANASLALGRVYAQAKDFPAAENTYAKLIKFSKDNGSVYYETKANYGLAQAKAAEGDRVAAKNMMTDALKMAKNIGENELAAEIDSSLKKLNN